MVKANIWRGLMAVGMKLHHFAGPKPPRPDFKIVIPSRLSPRGGTFKLVFYVPESYHTAPDDYRFPVVVNFHGGGFTLGTGTDDARWASTIVKTVDAVLVSVEYRLAPEYPFSTGVEDGTDAVIYLASHAEELRLDPQRMALSGFSAGGNFAFTVPLMLHDLQKGVGKRSLTSTSDNYYRPPSYPSSYASSAQSSSTLQLPRPLPLSGNSSTTSILKLTDLEPTELEMHQKVPDLKLRAIVSFYPPTDFRISRQEKRVTNPVPEMNLPPMLTNLFDDSYIHPTSSIDLADPYLSPAAGSDQLLRAAYPQDIILYTCEYDMLNAEGIAFGERLSGPEVGKTVHGGLVKEVPHAFDKKPNPIKFPVSADTCYAEACSELKRVFGGHVSAKDLRQLDKIKQVDRFEDDDQRDRVTGQGLRLLDETDMGDGIGGNDHGRPSIPDKYPANRVP
ncbi:AB hydrolase superfamily protein [Lachnellula hyalina]|uniref:AB hydrolase superfamily protein n=1 Tax=Lachnellula hyalina TaxID=1316788 RepID=A0A8H8TWX6_9HELO|nr:AB hydrolase superfamily protein [Lachnellula hyalina]TVY24927.1 AB hydrolase superfamily protein [Lachnellula hyalina]